MTKKDGKYTPFSGWTEFLDSEREDPYAMFKDAISYQLESVILNVQNELLKKGTGYTKETAFKTAICLVMERMLVIQNEHMPQSMDSMAASLFADLPGLSELRLELLDPNSPSRKKRGKFRMWWSRLFSSNK